jgi:hypothetical protein
MKAIIHYLAKYYGNKRYAAIVNWVNAQYSRSGELHGQMITLSDVNDFDVVGLLKNTVEILSVPFDTFIDGIQVLPRLNSTSSDFEPILKLNHKAFEKHYISAGLVINDMLIAYEGDEVKYSGNDQHITYSLSKKNEGKVILCGFINFSVPDSDVVGSLILTKDEIEGERVSGIANMFNGVDILSTNEWLSSSCALLLKRLLSETTSTSLLKTLKSEEVSYIRELIALSESFYDNGGSGNQKKESQYFSSYGRLIGRCYNRFSAMDKKVHSFNKVKDNVTPISVGRKSKKKEVNPTDTGDPKPPTYAERTKAKGFSNF